MLHLLLSRDWTANRDAVLNRIARDVKEKKGNRVLIVPELISHEMERQLSATAGDTASRYAEVLSFTRLARRVSDSMGSASRECLDNGGRIVAMASAARQLSSRLKAYAAVETRPEFLASLIDGIDEFKRCCITPQDLTAAAAQSEGSLAQKLEELALLMEGYDSLCSRGKRDPRDQMTWLLEQLAECDYAQKHTFYIDGFPDFTRQNFGVLEHLICHAPEVTVSLNCDRIGSDLLAFEKAGATAKEIYQYAVNAGIPVKVEILPSHALPLDVVREKLFQGPVVIGSAAECLHMFRGASVFQECMGAANQVQEWVRQGCRYRDITVVCADMTKYQPLMDMVFHRFHIPLYRSGTEDILQKSVITTVLNGLDAVLSGFDRKSMLRYLRSALSPLADDVCDLLENYAVTWGIRGKRWTEEWINHPDGLSGVWEDDTRKHLDELNEARVLAVTPLMHLQQGLRETGALRGQIMAVYRFLEEIHLAQRLADLSEDMEAAGDYRNAQILNQLWEILLSSLEQLYDVLGDTFWEPEHFERLLRLLLSQYDVGTIPPVLDAVQMGPVSAMRCHREKHLIILGAQEGNLPGYTGSAGVLTDQERVALRQLGVPLTGGAMEGIQAEYAEIYGVFCGAMESVSVYCSGEQPSFVYRRLRDLAGKESQVPDRLGFAAADEWEAGFYLAHWKEEAMAEGLGLGNCYKEASETLSHSLGKITRKNIQKLYGSTLNLSASRVDKQAKCRLSYFLEYGMKAKERKEAQIDPAEFGTYVHAVLEQAAREVKKRGGFRQVTLEETLEIAHRFSEEYAKEHFSQIESERILYLFQRNLRELDMVVEELWQELHDAMFEPEGFEVGFGRKTDFPAIEIPNKGIRAMLQGYVDRVDIWNNGYCNYYRVVDYKTGSKSFDYCDVFNGIGLQMLLYLFALRDSGEALLGKGAVAAAVQYFPARVPYLSAEGRMEDAEAREERAAKWKRSGLLLKDEQVLQAMEPGDSPKRMSYKRNKDGSLSGDLADREQLELLEGHVFRVLAELVEEIASGNVQPNPYMRGSSQSACDYCPYGRICHKETVAEKRNYQSMSAQRFWEEIGKEGHKNGR